MSKEATIKFYEEIFRQESLKQKFKAITTQQEFIKLAEQYGFTFTKSDLVEASYQGKSLYPEYLDTGFSKKFPLKYHYEFVFSDLPGFSEIAQEFEKLKIKPSTVDLKLYSKTFREDDLKFNSVSPSEPKFQLLYEYLLKSYVELDVPEPKPEYTWRPFHLINLDCHIEHSLYESYFQSKVNFLTFLEKLFDTEIRFSGSLWYPPSAYRLWHTNETQPGWRMYFVDFDGDLDKDDKSFFRYMNPKTKELVTLVEKPKIVRFFKIEQDKDKLFWHCIINATKLNRWSFGFLISDSWMNKLL